MAGPSVWTDERIAQVAKMLKQKRTYTQIAESIGTTRRLVVQYATKAGLRNAKPNTWKAHPDRVELLKKRWAEGASASVIAREIGNDVTRNAVIGQVQRLGLSKRDTKTTRNEVSFRPSSKGRPDQMQAMAKKPLAFVTPIDPNAPTPLNLTLEEREKHQCAFPVNDGGPFLYCGHGTAESSSYCPYHDRMMRTGPRPLPKLLKPFRRAA